MEESLARIGGYVSGNLLISVIAGTLAFVVLELLGVPFTAALGFWVAIDLSAPTVIVTLLVGACLAGLGGALIALPIAAAGKVVIRETWLTGRTTPATAAPATQPVDTTSQTPSAPR